jgi:hypothetical protein
MPFVKELLHYKNDYFVETGTYQGDTLDIVINNGFKNIYSIELSDVFYYNCIKKFLKNQNVKLFKGNSRYDLHKIISNINSPITFWLDGHWSGVLDVGCDKDILCPVIYELEQIRHHHIKTHTIMVDDIRLMDGNHFEVTKDQIEKKILEINPNYKIKYYNDDYAVNDVLVAYIDYINIKTDETKICIHKYLTSCKTNPQPPGLSDFIRGTIALFNYSKLYNYDLYIDNSHEIFNNLLKNNKIIENNILNQTIELLPPLTYDKIDFELNKLFLQNKSFCIMTNSFYTKDSNGNIENFGEISLECKKFLKQIFTPNYETKNYLNDTYKYLNLNLDEKYYIIHLRLGDNFLHNNIFDKDLFEILNEKIVLLLTKNYNKQFVLLSDSSNMANKLKIKNPKLFYWDNKKIHIGDLNHNNIKDSVNDTLIDFFMMQNCDKIFSYAFNGTSGFSKIASLIFDKEYVMI